MKARKRFGQHFLRDQGVINRIVAHTNARPGEQVLEIGPGDGALTGALVETGCNLSVVEIDRDLAAGLAERYGDRLTLYNQDILKFDFSRLGPGPFKIVGNLPYNISTPVMFKLFGNITLIDSMVFMFQLEVVERLCATSSTRSYGRLSVMAQYYCDIRQLMTVTPDCFVPPPRVTSAVAGLKPRADRDATPEELSAMGQILIRAFSQRRKRISNALSPYLSAADFSALELDPSLRPDHLTPAQYLACARHHIKASL